MRIRITTRPSRARLGPARDDERQPRAAPRVALHRAADLGQARAHPRKSRSLRRVAADTVVLDRQADARTVLDQRDAAMRRPRVPDDVRDRFAQPERQRALLIRVERDRRHVRVERDARRIERRPRRRQLLLEALAPVPVDRLADFGQRVARDPLDIADLANRPAEIAVRDLGRQLRLQDDDRERVAEQVVQIARDPLALGDRGHVLGHLVRLDERAILPPHLAEVNVRAADQDRDDDRGNPELRREREQQRLDGDDGEDDEQPPDGDGRPADVTDERGGENEEAARAGIVRRDHETDATMPKMTARRGRPSSQKPRK